MKAVDQKAVGFYMVKRRKVDKVAVGILPSKGTRPDMVDFKRSFCRWVLLALVDEIQICEECLFVNVGIVHSLI